MLNSQPCALQGPWALRAECLITPVMTPPGMPRAGQMGCKIWEWLVLSFMLPTPILQNWSARSCCNVGLLNPEVRVYERICQLHSSPRAPCFGQIPVLKSKAGVWQIKMRKAKLQERKRESASHEAQKHITETQQTQHEQSVHPAIRMGAVPFFGSEIQASQAAVPAPAAPRNSRAAKVLGMGTFQPWKWGNSSNGNREIPALGTGKFQCWNRENSRAQPPTQPPGELWTLGKPSAFGKPGKSVFSSVGKGLYPNPFGGCGSLRHSLLSEEVSCSFSGFPRSQRFFSLVLSDLPGPCSGFCGCAMQFSPKLRFPSLLDLLTVSSEWSIPGTSSFLFVHRTRVWHITTQEIPCRYRCVENTESKQHSRCSRENKALKAMCPRRMTQVWWLPHVFTNTVHKDTNLGTGVQPLSHRHLHVFNTTYFLL